MTAIELQTPEELFQQLNIPVSLLSLLKKSSFPRIPRIAIFIIDIMAPPSVLMVWQATPRNRSKLTD
jgi:hypothetical protein